MELMKTASGAMTNAVKTVTPGFVQRDNFLGRNKVKLLGLALITVNYLQLPANAEVIKELVSPLGFALINMGLGLAALWVGFLNNPEKE